MDGRIPETPAGPPEPGDRLALAIATGLGSGLLPKAPGTWGSLVALPVFVLFSRLSAPAFGLAVVVLFGVGVWASERAEKRFRKSDDGRIVIDEVVGQLIALAPLLGSTPPWGMRELGVLVTGFVAFRCFDIAKPGPVGWTERRFHRGFGVMADDVVAGALAALPVAMHLWLLGVSHGTQGATGAAVGTAAETAMGTAVGAAVAMAVATGTGMGWRLG